MDIEIATYYLERYGNYADIFSASDGREALELFEDFEATLSSRPDGFPPFIILLDINMPRMNGFEFLDAIVQLPQCTGRAAPSVVMLTSSDSQDDMQRAQQCDLVSSYITKPLGKAGAANCLPTQTGT